MKKFIAGLIVLFVFAVTVPWSASAQTCRGNRKYKKSYAGQRYNARGYSNRYAPRSYANRNYAAGEYAYRKRSLYQRHKHLVDIGIGTGAGALIGGLLRGKRGAGYGALIGAGSGLLYTTVLKPKKRTVYR